MDVFERVPACSTHNHTLSVFFPLEERTRTYAEFSSNLGRNGDLTLGCDFRLRQCHGHILPR
jgi:hypothetical protein